ncbi:MAG TPA: tetratricopeptide repeat protein [Bacteroidales bacterium]|nr:tetratricopeptide repeat protein [Bacteroidales bacterium]HQG55740.1 tetratricopeptide repeat protein [Bacteroidales bacterium]
MTEKNKYYLRVFLAALFLQSFVISSVSGQGEKRYLRQGNSKYFDGNYSESEILYRKAIEENRSSAAGNFNLGDALYRQNKFDDASKQFILSADMSADRIKKAESFFNLGNSLLKSNKIEESIEAYKNSLRLNPTSLEAKYNLAYAQDLLKKMQQQQQQQQKEQNQNKEQDQKEGKSDQQQQQQQNQDEKKQNQQEQQQQQMQQQKQGISKEDAERILSALENDEKKVQEKVKQANALRERVRTLKNW